MSFLEKFFGFFTLKTSDELRAAQGITKNPVHDTDRSHSKYMQDLDMYTDRRLLKYNTMKDNLIACSGIIRSLLGPELQCLLNEPVLAECSVMPNGTGICVQWQSGNREDERTVIIVSIDDRKPNEFDLICATKCIGKSTRSRATHKSGWMTMASLLATGLPAWFVAVLEDIKEANAGRITDSVSAFDANAIKPAIEMLDNSIKVIRDCRDIMGWVMHDEFQDLMYYPIKHIIFIRMKTPLYPCYEVVGVECHWEYANDTKKASLSVRYKSPTQIHFELNQTEKNTNNKVEVLSDVMPSVEAAKQYQLPKWFTDILIQIKEKA